MRQVGTVRGQRPTHDVPLVRVRVAQPRQLPVEDAANDRFVDDALIEGTRTEVGRLLGDVEALDHRRRRDHPGRAERRRERLGRTLHVDDVPVAVVGFDRTRVLGPGHVGEPQVAVRVVLDDQHLLTRAPLQQRGALLAREDAPGGILEIRDDVEELEYPSPPPASLITPELSIPNPHLIP